MNKSELIAAISEKSGLSKKDSDLALSAFMAAVSETLQGGDKVSIMGFGSFEPKKREARMSRNPRTGEMISLPATVAPVFKAGKQLKDAVAK